MQLLGCILTQKTKSFPTIYCREPEFLAEYAQFRRSTKISQSLWIQILRKVKKREVRAQNWRPWRVLESRCAFDKLISHFVSRFLLFGKLSKLGGDSGVPGRS